MVRRAVSSSVLPCCAVLLLFCCAALRPAPPRLVPLVLWGALYLVLLCVVDAWCCVVLWRRACVVLCCRVVQCVALCGLWCLVLLCAVLCCVVSFGAMRCYGALCCAVLLEMCWAAPPLWLPRTPAAALGVVRFPCAFVLCRALLCVVCGVVVRCAGLLASGPLVRCCAALCFFVCLASCCRALLCASYFLGFCAVPWWVVLFGAVPRHVALCSGVSLCAVLPCRIPWLYAGCVVSRRALLRGAALYCAVPFALCCAILSLVLRYPARCCALLRCAVCFVPCCFGSYCFPLLCVVLFPWGCALPCCSLRCCAPVLYCLCCAVRCFARWLCAVLCRGGVLRVACCVVLCIVLFCWLMCCVVSPRPRSPLCSGVVLLCHSPISSFVFFFLSKRPVHKCQGSQWTKFEVRYRFRRSQGMHTGCSS